MASSNDILTRLPADALALIADRVVALARKEGADHLIDLLRGGTAHTDKELISLLPIRLLRKLSRTLDIADSSGTPKQLVSKILRKHRRDLGLGIYDGDPPVIDPDMAPELLKWALEYCRAAEKDGHDVDFGYDDPQPVATTVRLICDMYPYAGWPELLSWQRYGSVPKAKRWVMLTDFTEPHAWFGATVFLDDPWQLPFCGLISALEPPQPVTFRIRWANERPSTRTERQEWVSAVLDGMRYDLDDDEFEVLAAVVDGDLEISLQCPGMCRLDGYSRDRKGIYWQGRRR